MPQNVLDIKIGGTAQDQEGPLSQWVAFANGYGANNLESEIAVSPIFNGVGYIIDGLRDTVAGKTLRLRSVNTNHLTLDVGGATSDLSWTISNLITQSLTVNGPSQMNGTLDVTGAVTLHSTLNVSGAVTLSATVHVVGAATLDSTLAVAGAATLSSTVHAVGAVTLDSSLTVKGNTALGDANTDTVTVIGVSTFRNAANTATQVFVDAGNNRVIVGSGTALGSDTTPNLQVIGRLYVAPETANDFALEIRRSSAAAVGFDIGVTSTSDLVFKDLTAVETFRVGAVASTYQATVTGALHTTAGLVVGSAASVTTTLTVGGQITVTAGNLVLSAGGISATNSSTFGGGVSITGGGLGIVGAITISASTGTANQVPHGGATPAWGPIATADIAANAVTQNGSAAGSTSDPTTTSASYADLTDMSVTLTAVGGDLVADFSGVFFNTSAGVNGTVAFSLGGASEVCERLFTSGSGSATSVVAMRHIFTGVAAGSQTVKVRWKTAAGTLHAFLVQREMSLIELRK